jgi:hypothetical protein
VLSLSVSATPLITAALRISRPIRNTAAYARRFANAAAAEAIVET